ncbi:hypothetical protein DM02DRAFT_691835 [Periconia macrospinosa]|uniref:Helicase C-terminal domain-containing protein n=1 Tax=Periconia macrospinosa TaxID=97972 RepID=A0A2V1DA53_9PLEO|nr:hypothetical protein DM02DRAFT_691835 [Periconia macrospinosa]
MKIHLEKKKFRSSIYRIDGQNVPDLQTRMQILEQYGRDPGAILLATTSCLQEGLNITEATHVIFLAETWTPVNETQAYCRVYRIGQTETVIVESLYGRPWIDAMIAKKRDTKRYYEYSIIQGGQAATSEVAKDNTVEDAWDAHSPLHPDSSREYFRSWIREHEAIHRPPSENGSPQSQLHPSYLMYKDRSRFERRGHFTRDLLSYLTAIEAPDYQDQILDGADDEF